MQQAQKIHVNIPEEQSLENALSQLAGFSRKRGCVPIPVEFFTEVLPTLSEAEIRVYLYQLYRTLGFGKQTDSISNQQFIEGIQHKDGTQHDRGCGLKSKRAVVNATQKLHQRGLVTRTRQRKAMRGDCPNKYTVEIESQAEHKSTPRKASKPARGCMKVPPQRASKKLDIQRCYKSNSKKKSKQFLDPARVDYLIAEIESATGDDHSRGAFAQIALTVSEDRIMQIISLLKDRNNIENKGAWFLAVARKYQNGQVIRDDTSSGASYQESNPAARKNLDDLISQRKQLLQQVDMNQATVTCANPPAKPDDESSAVASNKIPQLHKTKNANIWLSDWLAKAEPLSNQTVRTRKFGQGICVPTFSAQRSRVRHALPPPLTCSAVRRGFFAS